MKKKELLTEIGGLSVPELRAKSAETAEELMKLRFKAASGQYEHTHRLRELRRNIARTQTVLNQKRASSKKSSTTSAA